jgi:hypothetical protein
VWLARSQRALSARCAAVGDDDALTRNARVIWEVPMIEEARLEPVESGLTPVKVGGSLSTHETLPG